MSNTNNMSTKLSEVAGRIREMREISGYTIEEMAEKTGVSIDEYKKYEAGVVDFPFTFIHNCALAFNIEMTDILEGESARLSSYTVTRKGKGQTTAKEDGIEIQNLAPMFKNKLAEPYYVTYQYSNEQHSMPIHLTKHSGQEFDLILEGNLKVQVGDHIEVLEEGDSIFYNSSTPHGMIAVGGKDCKFLAVVISGEEKADEKTIQKTLVSAGKKEDLVCKKFIKTEENELGHIKSISFKNEDNFNFAFDVVDEIARKYPDKTAMVHIGTDLTENIFTFKNIKDACNQTANYFKSLGIKKATR